MLTNLLAAFGGDIIDKLLGRLMQPFEMYLKKEITKEELRARTLQSFFDVLKEVDVAHADAIKSTFSDVMDAMKTSVLMQRMWALAVGSQLFVLIWHQIGIPAWLYFIAGPEAKYPSSGTTAEWAYLLLGFLFGAGPVILRAGPGALNWEAIKSYLPRQ